MAKLSVHCSLSIHCDWKQSRLLTIQRRKHVLCPNFVLPITKTFLWSVA